MVKISPISATVGVNATQLFTINVLCGCKQGQLFTGQITLQVNGVTAGDSTHGTIVLTTPDNGVFATATYTAPAAVPSPATVTVTAISVEDPTKSASAIVTIVSGMTAKLEGSYAFLFKPSPGEEGGTVAGRFVADANGNLFDGVEEVIESTGVERMLPFVGRYALRPDQRGTLTLETTESSITLSIVLDAEGNAQIVEPDGHETVRRVGVLEKQMPANFSQPVFSGDFSLALSGVGDSGEQVTVLGGFSAESGGLVSGGRLQIVGKDSVATKISFHGGYQISPEGRGVATLMSPELGLLDFSFYVVSKGNALFIGGITSGGEKFALAGEAHRAP